jgi:hypothetical protein
MTLLQEESYRVEPQPEAEVRVRVDWKRTQPSWPVKGKEATYTVGEGARRAVRDYGADLDRLANS